MTAPDGGGDPVIVTRGLTKRYGQGRGLFALDLEVGRGEVFGLLGPNGAGKTTTIRLLMGLIRPTAGSAEVFALHCWTRAREVKRHVGYVPGELPDFGAMRGREVVAFVGGAGGRADPARARALAERLQLDLALPYRQYSRGNKQKLALVLAFLHRPPLLILDEPTGGLDPLNQQAFYALVAEARAEGATVLLSSHVLSEVERICDRVGIVRAGRLAEVASLHALHALHAHRLDIEFAGPVPVEAVRAAAGVEQVAVQGQHLRCLLHGSFDPLLQALAAGRVLSLDSHEPSLEETFLEHYAAAGTEG